jgi:cytochrome c peroxidase
VSLWIRSLFAGASLLGALLAGATHAPAQQVFGRESPLPAGTDFGAAAATEPREILASEAQGGKQSFTVALGNMLFSSPDIFGEPVHSAGISCETCHSAGHVNVSLYVPGMSGPPGTFDVSNGFFHPVADDHVFNPIRVPSLRGVRFLAPYGRDGRIASLRDFTRNVIVGEFAGAEPDPLIVDALVSYMQEIEFLPNPRLQSGGRLAADASDAERRGEALFQRPFAQMEAQSCASCHIPSAAFVDHRQHDVGSGGLFKTPTLLGLLSRTPYFHDGRYASVEEAIAHFDRKFGLGLTNQEKADLLAYLCAIGDSERPEQPIGVTANLDEIETFAGTLDRLIRDRRHELLSVAVDTISHELRELQEQFFAHDLRPQRGRIARIVVALRRVESAALSGDDDATFKQLSAVLDNLKAARPVLQAAEARSLFNPGLRQAYYEQLRRLQVASEAK